MSQQSSEIFTIYSQRGNRALDYVLTSALASATKLGESLAALLTLVITLLFKEFSFVTKQAGLALHQIHELLLFYKSNYKFYADIGSLTAYIWRRTVVIYTGASPTVFRSPLYLQAPRTLFHHRQIPMCKARTAAQYE